MISEPVVKSTNSGFNDDSEFGEKTYSYKISSSEDSDFRLNSLLSENNDLSSPKNSLKSFISQENMSTSLGSSHEKK